MYKKVYRIEIKYSPYGGSTTSEQTTHDEFDINLMNSFLQTATNWNPDDSTQRNIFDEFIPKTEEILKFLFLIPHAKYFRSIAISIWDLLMYLQDKKITTLYCPGDSPSKPGYVISLLDPSIDVIVFPFSYNKTLFEFQSQIKDEKEKEKEKQKVDVLAMDRLSEIFKITEDFAIFDYIGAETKTMKIIQKYFEEKNQEICGKMELDIENIKKKMHNFHESKIEYLHSKWENPKEKNIVLASQEFFSDENAQWLDSNPARCADIVLLNGEIEKGLASLLSKTNTNLCRIIVALIFFIIKSSKLMEKEDSWKNPTSSIDSMFIYTGFVFNTNICQILQKNLLFVYRNFIDEDGERFINDSILFLTQTEKQKLKKHILLRNGLLLAQNIDNPWKYDSITELQSSLHIQEFEDKILNQFDESELPEAFNTSNTVFVVKILIRKSISDFNEIVCCISNKFPQQHYSKGYLSYFSDKTINSIHLAQIVSITTIEKKAYIDLEGYVNSGIYSILTETGDIISIKFVSVNEIRLKSTDMSIKFPDEIYTFPIFLGQLINFERISIIEEIDTVLFKLEKGIVSIAVFKWGQPEGASRLITKCHLNVTDLLPDKYSSYTKIEVLDLIEQELLYCEIYEKWSSKSLYHDTNYLETNNNLIEEMKKDLRKSRPLRV